MKNIPTKSARTGPIFRDDSKGIVVNEMQPRLNEMDNVLPNSERIRLALFSITYTMMPLKKCHSQQQHRHQQMNQNCKQMD